MREFPVIDSATSVEQLRMRLQQNELEQYGEAFTPDFVYEVIRRLPRFSTMRVSINVLVSHAALTLFPARASARCRGVSWLLTRRTS